MKKKHATLPMFLIVAGLLFAGCSTGAKAQVSVSAGITYQTFYDDLSPYGTWIDYPSYGHVWHPRVDGNFRPYLSNGYWDYSNEGWLWQSNYNWGWAPFHYGRWFYDDRYGWLWIPGYDWSPAWVTWGNYDDNYCWAPLMPEVNVGISFGYWRPTAFYWNVCPRNYIYDRNVYNHIVNRTTVTNNYNKITIINNYNTTNVHKQYYSKGPDPKEVQRYTGNNIPVATIRNMNNKPPVISDNRGNISRMPVNEKRADNTINVYRPEVSNPQPRQFRRMDASEGAPVRSNEDKPENRMEQQQRNIDRMPMHTAPPGSFRTQPPAGNRMPQMRGGNNRGGGRRH